jgi:hypothetical protein
LRIEVREHRLRERRVHQERQELQRERAGGTSHFLQYRECSFSSVVESWIHFLKIQKL